MLVLTQAVNGAIMIGVDREKVFDEIMSEGGIQAPGQYQRKLRYRSEDARNLH
jgi:hypothetical protein